MDWEEVFGSHTSGEYIRNSNSSTERKQSELRMGKGPKWTFLKRRHINGQHMCKKTANYH